MNQASRVFYKRQSLRKCVRQFSQKTIIKIRRINNRKQIDDFINYNQYDQMSTCIMEGYCYPWYYQQDSHRSNSSDTTQDESPDRFIPKRNKEKSQLCKKFMEHGYCPYESKCKFAHGAHQLRCNNQSNNRYKTKQCVGFFKNGWCFYGERCNFLHTCKQLKHEHENKWKAIKQNFREMFQESRSASRFFPK